MAKLLESGSDPEEANTEHQQEGPKTAGTTLVSSPLATNEQFENPGNSDRVYSPEDLLQHFINSHPGTTLADIKHSASVHTAEFQDWRRGKLKSDSVMSQRIEAVLSGATLLKKKPRKRRAE